MPWPISRAIPYYSFYLPSDTFPLDRFLLWDVYNSLHSLGRHCFCSHIFFFQHSKNRHSLIFGLIDVKHGRHVLWFNMPRFPPLFFFFFWCRSFKDFMGSWSKPCILYLSPGNNNIIWTLSPCFVYLSMADITSIIWTLSSFPNCCERISLSQNYYVVLHRKGGHFHFNQC